MERYSTYYYASNRIYPFKVADFNRQVRKFIFKCMLAIISFLIMPCSVDITSMLCTCTCICLLMKIFLFWWSHWYYLFFWHHEIFMIFLLLFLNFNMFDVWIINFAETFHFIHHIIIWVLFFYLFFWDLFWKAV